MNGLLGLSVSVRVERFWRFPPYELHRVGRAGIDAVAAEDAVRAADRTRHERIDVHPHRAYLAAGFASGAAFPSHSHAQAGNTHEGADPVPCHKEGRNPADVTARGPGPEGGPERSDNDEMPGPYQEFLQDSAMLRAEAEIDDVKTSCPDRCSQHQERPGTADAVLDPVRRTRFCGPPDQRQDLLHSGTRAKPTAKCSTQYQGGKEQDSVNDQAAGNDPRPRGEDRHHRRHKQVQDLHLEQEKRDEEQKLPDSLTLHGPFRRCAAV